MTSPTPPSPSSLALLQACAAGDQPAALTALNQAADPNARDEHNRTPLHFAARGGHPELIRCLVQAGALVDEFIRYDPDPENCPAHAVVSVEGPRLPMTNWSIGWGEQGGGCTPLMTAARLNQAQAIEALLGAGADPNHTVQRIGLSAGPALCLAARHGSLGAIRSLVAGGANLELRSDRPMGYQQGMTPLAVAIRSEQSAAADLLIELGADTIDVPALTLQAAVMTLDLERTRDLLAQGSDPMGLSSDGQSAAIMGLLSRDLALAQCFASVGPVLNRSQIYDLTTARYDEDYALEILPAHMIRQAPKAIWSEWRSKARSNGKKRLAALLKDLEAQPA